MGRLLDLYSGAEIPAADDPNVRIKLDKQKKKIVTSKGEELDIPDEYSDLLLSDDIDKKAELAMYDTLQTFQKKIPGGPLLTSFATSGAAGGIVKTGVYLGDKLGQLGDWFANSKKKSNELVKTADQYLAYKNAANRTYQQNLKEHPFQTIGGSILEAGAELPFLPETASIRGGIATGAGLSLARSGPDILTNTGEALEEAAIGGVLGGATAAALKPFEKISQARKARGLTKESIEAANAAEEARIIGIRDSNKMALEAHKAKDEAVTIERQQKIDQYKLAVNQSEINYQNALNTHSADSHRLKLKYENDLRAWENAVRQEESRVAQAQKNRSQESIRNAENVSKYMKESEIYPGEFSLDQFIENDLMRRGFSNDAEKNNIIKFVKGLIGKDSIKGSDIVKIYQGIEQKMSSKISSEAKQALSDTKQYLFENLPSVVSNARMYNKKAETFFNRSLNSFDRAINDFSQGVQREINIGNFQDSSMINNFRENVLNRLLTLTPEEFATIPKNPNFAQEFVNEIFNDTALATSTSNKATLADLMATPSMRYEFERAKANFVADFNNILEKTFNDAYLYQIDAENIVGKNLAKSVGFEPQATSIQPPISPTYPAKPTKPPGVQYPNLPQKPAKPTLQPEPQFNPQQVPAPGNTWERIADSLENFHGGKVFENKNLLIAGGLHMLGVPLKVEAAAGAAVAATKALTGKHGDAIRRIGQQLAIEAEVDLVMQQLPSYRDGILVDPVDRLALSDDVENMPELTLESKAMLQSKINRGIPLGQPIR